MLPVWETVSLSPRNCLHLTYAASTSQIRILCAHGLFFRLQVCMIHIRVIALISTISVLVLPAQDGRRLEPISVLRHFFWGDPVRRLYAVCLHACYSTTGNAGLATRAEPWPHRYYYSLVNDQCCKNVLPGFEDCGKPYCVPGTYCICWYDTYACPYSRASALTPDP